jgi:tetratricopeptide (TPR) repeat protein
MKRFLFLCLALATLFAPLATRAASETMSERELKRILQRERTVIAAAQNAGENMDRSNTEMQLREIVRDYESLLRKDPQCVPAYIAYGLFLNSAGEAKRAYDIFKKAEKLEPELAVIKNQLGNHHAEEGEYKEALDYYLGAIALEPKEALYHYQLGTLLYEYREFFIDAKLFTRDALLTRSGEAFARAAELAPDNIAYTYRHAESFYDLPTPDWAAALAAWKSIEQRTKAGVELQTVLLHEANVLLQLGDRTAARAMLDRVTEAPLQGNKQKLVDQLGVTPDKAP